MCLGVGHFRVIGVGMAFGGGLICPKSMKSPRGCLALPYGSAMVAAFDVGSSLFWGSWAAWPNWCETSDEDEIALLALAASSSFRRLIWL